MYFKFVRIPAEGANVARYAFSSIFSGEIEIDTESGEIRFLTAITDEDFMKDLKTAAYLKLVKAGFPDRATYAAG